jgi:hypothetical protein
MCFVPNVTGTFVVNGFFLNCTHRCIIVVLCSHTVLYLYAILIGHATSQFQQKAVFDLTSIYDTNDDGTCCTTTSSRNENAASISLASAFHNCCEE